MMKPMKTISVLMATVATALLLSGWSLFGADKAESLGEVDTIELDANTCRAAFSQELRANGFGVTDSRRSANATLEVRVNAHPSDVVGRDGTYAVKLVGDDGKILFTHGGHESSIDHAELCDDISDDVVDALERRIS
jgi:hypothetical protein